jgi:uncharacterized protein (TIGR03083 family)
MADAHLEALRSSVARLHRLVADMSEHDLTASAYPTEWTVADVLSHLGSGAVITTRRFDDALGGRDTPEDFAPGVWDVWNAKGTIARRDDALAADADLLERLDAATRDEQAAFISAMGPLTLDFANFVGMRLNEHAFHTWDIEVAADPAATIPDAAAALIVDNLELIARFTAKPTGDTRTITVATTSPGRRFTIELTPDAVALSPAGAESTADLVLPAEAFSRLVYGRLDPDHIPADGESDEIKILRRVFPGP